MHPCLLLNVDDFEYRESIRSPVLLAVSAVTRITVTTGQITGQLSHKFNTWMGYLKKVKRSIATALHAYSLLRKLAFVSVDCGAAQFNITLDLVLVFPRKIRQWPKVSLNSRIWAYIGLGR